MPDVLYHYCSNDALCAIVQSKNIRLSSMSLSNDSMEGKWLLAQFREECINRGFTDAQYDELRPSLDFLVERFDALGFCLSEESDSLSQWRGYANDGAGACIGFSKNYLEEDSHREENVSGYRLLKVEYGNAAIGGTLNEIFKSLEKKVSEGVYDKIGLMNAPSNDSDWEVWRKKRAAAALSLLPLGFELFKVKNPAFKEEKEWRIISFAVRGLDKKLMFRSDGTSIIPFREYQLLGSKRPISSVQLGPKNTSNIEDVKAMLEIHDFENVEVTRSQASYR